MQGAFVSLLHYRSSNGMTANKPSLGKSTETVKNQGDYG